MQLNSSKPTLNRRAFLKTAGVAAVAFPTIVPSTVLGANSPGNRITIGCIGMGRMGRGDTLDFLRFPGAQVIAVCDVDARRLAEGRQLVEENYGRQTSSGSYRGCAAYRDFRELIERKEIDAVSIVTPDHWHALPALAAARAGKDIFLQKPLTYTVAEGRLLSDTVQRLKRVLQVGSQQRSDAKFRKACELVRNGHLGQVKRVKVGFGTDPSTGDEPAMPTPANLDYDFWLGPAPWAPYTEKRVHPQQGYDRPGWLRIKEYCHGMITGWGSHHMDIAHWGLGTELSGPLEIQAWGEFPKAGLWTVHGKFQINYSYPNGVEVICAGDDVNKPGIVFEGTEGWVYVTRGAIDAHPESLLESEIPAGGVRLYRSNDHKANFLECIRSRKEPVAPVEVGHRSNTACILGSIAMETGKRLKWDAMAERFLRDPTSDRLLTRAMREPWRL